ncbi:hypothetical protein cyc_01017 [Cyclospora cayetanensis]|uniref:Uncharacterized protein n=1 Tax=Cyclospora cayetanensis TaxID=88456 RepID=A0A1D3CWG3_9EIME|nr:hypothetical protein cyc_01017 [Cyclospora cayetanensis]
MGYNKTQTKGVSSLDLHPLHPKDFESTMDISSTRSGSSYTTNKEVEHNILSACSGALSGQLMADRLSLPIPLWVGQGYQPPKKGTRFDEASVFSLPRAEETPLWKTPVNGPPELKTRGTVAPETRYLGSGKTKHESFSCGSEEDPAALAKCCDIQSIKFAGKIYCKQQERARNALGEQPNKAANGGARSKHADKTVDTTVAITVPEEEFSEVGGIGLKHPSAPAKHFKGGQYGSPKYADQWATGNSHHADKDVDADGEGVVTNGTNGFHAEVRLAPLQQHDNQWRKRREYKEESLLPGKGKQSSAPSGYVAQSNPKKARRDEMKGFFAVPRPIMRKGRLREDLQALRKALSPNHTTGAGMAPSGMSDRMPSIDIGSIMTDVDGSSVSSEHRKDNIEHGKGVATFPAACDSGATAAQAPAKFCPAVSSESQDPAGPSLQDSLQMIYSRALDIIKGASRCAALEQHPPAQNMLTAAERRQRAIQKMIKLQGCNQEEANAAFACAEGKPHVWFTASLHVHDAAGKAKPWVHFLDEALLFIANSVME